MVIDRIRFDNYRAYYGEVVFDFPVDGERNVSIIFANNDVGKTCFFSGVLFCLYGTKDADSLLDLINVNAQREEHYSASVTIFATQDGERLSITRSISLKGDLKGDISGRDLKCTLDITRDDVPIVADSDEKMDLINSIVHEDAAQYFFFDGEKINDYSVANGEDYREAIARILGIKEVENAIEDLKRIGKEYEKERDACLAKQEIYQDTLEHKRQLDSEVQGYEDTKRSYAEEIQAAQGKIEAYEEELKKFDDISSKVTRKQQLVAESALLQQKRDALDEKRNELFQKNATMIVGAGLYDRFSRDRGARDRAPNLNDEVQKYLEHVMTSPYCICGEKMTPEHQEHIRQFITEHLVDDDAVLIQSEREELFDSIARYLTHGIECRTEFLSCSEEIYNVEVDITERKRELMQLKRDIGSFNEEAGEKIQQDIHRIEDKIEDIKYKAAQNDMRLEDSRKELTEVESQLAQYSQANEESARSQRKLVYAQKLQKAFEAYLGQLLEEKRRTVEEKATEVFLSITNNPQKYRGIKINGDYRLLLELTDGEQYEIQPGRMLNPSTGQSKVISLSYIAGLNKSSDYAAPIIIDNPLGLFSDEHREAIMKYLPKFGKQIIFMVSTGDLTDKYRQIIGPHVRTEYYLGSKETSTWPKTEIVDKEEF